MFASLTIWVGDVSKIFKTIRAQTHSAPCSAQETRKRVCSTAQRLTPIFAKIAEGYGAKAYTIRTSDELRAALADAKKQDRAVLFDIKVLPKTMTPGFESWWRVGVAEVSKSETVAAAYDDMQKHIANTFDY